MQKAYCTWHEQYTWHLHIKFMLAVCSFGSHDNGARGDVSRAMAQLASSHSHRQARVTWALAERPSLRRRCRLRMDS